MTQKSGAKVEGILLATVVTTWQLGRVHVVGQVTSSSSNFQGLKWSESVSTRIIPILRILLIDIFCCIF